ncbi:Glucan 1,3-beta-glucosidase [Zalerion maritima]|uniref:Glucan 1,3-beta-glucosidase n=1 Tax=Zalerion maritima TaxID=339359 RepID=A0AAD5RGC6_9PEZI|nr:Glucan 1,3-beta-glucosidase [Zalerion maritima]
MNHNFFLCLGALILGVQAYWMEEVQHQGIVPGNTNSSYEIFRNVKDYGALGDGETDDTDAIKLAMTDGNRCAPFECAGGTTTPAVVYFPPGTYMISSTITDYFYTQIIGDPTDMPVLKASSDFPPDDGQGSTGGFGMIDGIPYGANGLAWLGVNSFFRQIRNIEIDMSGVAGKATGIHWPTAQATSIQNVVFRMAHKDTGLEHTGIFIEEGSGGFMEGLEFHGGKIGANFGNQQFTVRNLYFVDCETAINQLWDWTWTYQNIKVENCDVGIEISSDAYAESGVGSLLVIDSWFKDVPVAIKTPRVPGNMTPEAAASLVINQVEFDGCETIVLGPDDEALVPGGSGSVVVNFAQGHVWDPVNLHQDYTGDNATYFPRLTELENSDGRYFSQAKPHYDDVPITSFVSARSFGCAGDGETDDSTCLARLVQTAASQNKIVFLDAGHYKTYTTLYIPSGSRIVGEGLSSVIVGTGTTFQHMANPQPVVQVGVPGEKGRIEWSDTLVATRGPTPGAIIIQYNLYTEGLEPSGLWDVHVRVGGFAGSELQIEQCAITPDVEANESNLKSECIAGFMSMHITKYAGGVYTENCWLWIADHDIESPTNAQVTIFVGRGLLVESKKGKVWIIGSGSEHHTLYNYQLRETHDVWMGLIQSETPYYQPNPPAHLPFPTMALYGDPDFLEACGDETGEKFSEDNPPCAMAWGLRVLGSQNIGIFGTGLYSFFYNNDNTVCKAQDVDWCQARMIEIEDGNGSETYERKGKDKRRGHGHGGRGGRSNSADDDTKHLIVYNLNTLGSVSMVTRYGEDVAFTENHIEGYNSGLAVYLDNEP